MKNPSTHICLLIAAFALNTPGAVMATPGSSLATEKTLTEALNSADIGNSLIEAIIGQHGTEDDPSISSEATTTIATLTGMLKFMHHVASTHPVNIGAAIIMKCTEGNSAERDGLVINSLYFGLHPDTALFRNNATLLHFAACHGYIEMANAAINAGANLNIQDSLHRTPLDYAVAHRSNPNCRTIATLLIGHGAETGMVVASNGPHSEGS